MAARDARMIPVRLFTIAYGERYLDWFDNACSRSLLWPKNKAALLGRVEAWDIWTTPKDAERAVSIASRLGVKVDLHPGLKGDRSDLLPALIGQMQLCREKAFIFAAPDNIFGDGSIRTLLEVGSPPGICVAVPTLRVAAEGFVEAMGAAPKQNSELVKLAFHRLHSGFAGGDVTKKTNNGWESGVTWRPLGDGLYAVTHLMPSSYFMQPRKSDVKWMGDRPKFGCYDHQFPAVLVAQQRQRVIGSSDAAFMVELTVKDAGIAPMIATDQENPDRYISPFPHHGPNRNCVCIWRVPQ